MTPNRKLLYVTDATVNFYGKFAPSHRLEHLTCFLPALLALGAKTLPDVPERHMWAARGFAHTCWLLYADSPTGLAPDEVIMRSTTKKSGPSPFGQLWTTHLDKWEQSGAKGDPPGVRPAPPIRDIKIPLDYTPVRAGYYLRPETVESFYVLWRTTGDEVWRDRGWEVFKALERETRLVGGGYACLKNAHHIHGAKKDEMPR
jgi:hypothetical protein